MWECKLCDISPVSSRYEILKHYKLKHGHYSHRHRHHCVYTRCSCTFKSYSKLLSHIYRTHSTEASPKSVEQCSFSCKLCACHELLNERDYFSHINEHLRSHETVTCMFEGCMFQTNIYSTFHSHKNRKHTPHTLNDFKSDILTGTARLQESDSPVADGPSCSANTCRFRFRCRFR